MHLVLKETPPNPEVWEDSVPNRYEDRENKWASAAIPGALFQAVVDTSHPLGYGFSDRYFTLKIGAETYAYLEKGWNVDYLQEAPLSLGFSGWEAKRKVENSLVTGVEQIGRGRVIYLVDDPLYRAFWQQGEFLFANAVFFGGL